MAPARLSRGAIILLKQFVDSWEGGARCLHLGKKMRGRIYSNLKDHQRARILERLGYLSVFNAAVNSYTVTPRGIARLDIERLIELVGRAQPLLLGSQSRDDQE